LEIADPVSTNLPTPVSPDKALASFGRLLNAVLSLRFLSSERNMLQVSHFAKEVI
jgi:hypothetical protein